MHVPLYDSFDDYDRLIRWERRLAHELPFIVEQLGAVGARRVLDVACGTGKHAIELAQRGYQVTGADLSAGMVERAMENAVDAGCDVQFVVAGFGQLAAQVKGGFDALLCLGNSLPHVLTREELLGTLADFASVLRPGGLLFIQNRNFDRVLAREERWMAPLSHREGEREWVFLRLYDLNADGPLSFHVITLAREGNGAWTQQVESTQLRPWQKSELLPAIADAGFVDARCYGDMTGSAFDPAESGNLIVTANLT